MPCATGVRAGKGKAPGCQEGGRITGMSLDYGFHGNEPVRQGQQAQDWLIGIISGLPNNLQTVAIMSISQRGQVWLMEAESPVQVSWLQWGEPGFTASPM